MTTAQITMTHGLGKKCGEHIVQIKHFVHHRDDFMDQDVLDARAVAFVERMKLAGVLPRHDVSIMPAEQYVDSRPRVEVEVSEDAK